MCHSHLRRQPIGYKPDVLVSGRKSLRTAARCSEHGTNDPIYKNKQKHLHVMSRGPEADS